MRSVSIGASKNTTGLLSGDGSDPYAGGHIRYENETPAETKSWFAKSEGDNGKSSDDDKPSSKPRKSNVALSLATSIASSAASAAAGAIATGAKAATKAVVDRATNTKQTTTSSTNSSDRNGGKTTPNWRQMPWSRPSSSASNAEQQGPEAAETESSSTPSWVEASAAPSVSANHDYGMSDHLPDSRGGLQSSLSAAWNNRPSVLPSLRLTYGRRNQSPAIVDHGAEANETAAPAAQNGQLAVFGDLLSTPPATITFVIRRRRGDGIGIGGGGSNDNRNAGTGDAGRRNRDSDGLSVERSGSSREKLRDLLGVRLVKTPVTRNRFRVVRDDWIDEDEAGGEGKSSNGTEHDREIAETETRNNEGKPSLTSPLLPQELTVLLRPGDILESVDGVAVGGRTRIAVLGRNRRWDERDLCEAIQTAEEAFTTKGSRDETEGDGPAEGTEPDSGGETRYRLPKNGGEEEEGQPKSCYYTTTLTFVCSGTLASSESSTQSVSESSLTDEIAADSSKATESSLSSPNTVTSPSVTVTTDNALMEKESPVAPKPSNSRRPMVHRTYFVDQSRANSCIDEEASLVGALEDFLTLPTIQKSPSKQRFGLGSKDDNNGTNDPNMAGTSLLRIGSIPENHWLGRQTKVRTGDVLLCADDIPCCNGDVSPTDLSEVWRNAIRTKLLIADPVQDGISSSSFSAAPRFVGITTCSLPPTMLAAIRKRAVAMGGGALIGTGAVLMVTPLHPVGHAMAIGGLGVLGTEFETPRRAFQNARQSAVNLASKLTKKPKAKDETPENNNNDDDDDDDVFVNENAHC
eukprot:CAMPEP_0197176128 /NCGR_PEP_ID=MMETSP1423-20130617/2160_1 /TAXON_ID=476441 /ORGANISM="Pseudo-nitzschia heimii, Strain UNC1101" /LENGTH=804 /DNA_ID=CAMNT_0042625451 /DNA_START=185 /DNA_END=2599 /DNA_ORIENTATION=-